MHSFKDYSVSESSSLLDPRHRMEQYALYYSRGLTPSLVTWPATTEITFGDVVGDSSFIDGHANTPWGTLIPGSFSWNDPTYAPNAGTQLIDATFTPDNERRFTTETDAIMLIVNRFTPTVTSWPTASGITYEENLSQSVLTGGSASVPGHFEWSEPTFIPPAGVAAYEVTFVPTDSANYNEVTNNVTLSVARANPNIISWPTATPISFGQVLSSSTLEGGSASVAGAFSWVSPSIVPDHSVNYDARFVPNDTANYNTITGGVYLRVNKVLDTSWVEAHNGTTWAFNATGAVITNSEVRWRGWTLVENKSSTVYSSNESSGTSLSSGTGNRSGSVTAPSVSSGWTLVWSIVGARMSHSNSAQRGGSMSIFIGGQEVVSTPDWWTAGSRGGERSASPGQSYSISFNRAAGKSYTASSAGETRQSQTTSWTETYHTTNPGVTGAATRTHWGTLGNNVTSPWYSLGLTGGANRVLTHSIGGSNRANMQVKIEYYTTG